MAKVKAKKPATKKPARKVANPAAKKPVAQKAAAKTPLKKSVKKPVAKAKPAKKAVAKKIVAKPAPSAKRPAGLPEQLRDAALKILDERKAEEVICIELQGRSSVADYLIIASGRAGRQLAAIAHYLSEAFSKLGISRTRVEGLPEANWVLVDSGDVIVHLFRPEVRGFYNLEGIWGKRA